MMIFAGILGLAQSLFLPALIVMKLAKLRGGYDIYTDYPAYFLPGYSECCSSADLTDTGQMSQVLNGEKVQWMLLPEVFPNNTDGAKEIFDQCVADGVCVKQACSDGYYKNYCLYQVNRK